ncbi:MAG: putative TIM-barrel fold metal-dependent hydrolase [Bacteroidetes bacterium]|nr:MAG: putative TIM-barrel fold metal-dependent hydrolase [Bacteroidota bacterium]
MLRRLIFLPAIIMGLTSCLSDRTSADLIIQNAVIYTADSVFSIQAAMAIADGKILQVGDNDLINGKYRADSVIDAGGKAIYPGFVDAHSHFYGFSLLSRYADLSEATSFERVLEILQEQQEKTQSNWITGRGWDQNKWPGHRFPDNKRLNELFPEIPVVLIRVDGHAVLANEAAIVLSGLTTDSIVNKKEAIIENGNFTGIFMESMADRFRNLIPEPAGQELTDLVTIAAEKCYQVGLTMVTDAGLDARIIDFYDSLQQEDNLQLTIYAMLNPNEENFGRFLKRGIVRKPKLIVRSVKVYADGALGSRGACLLKPYSDSPGDYGILTITPEDLGRYCVMAYDHGYQVNTHAIGDSAIRTVLKVYSDYLLPDNDLRWRIEHAQVVHPDDFRLFGEFSIIPSVQATHATSDMGWAKQRLGDHRIRNAYAYKSLMDQNGWIPNGTDFPIEDINPVFTFYASVARKDIHGRPSRGFQKENALTRQEALRSITLWAAKACFEEDRRGSIEPGKNADFVITDRDMMQVPEREILLTKITRTVINGQTVFLSK